MPAYIYRYPPERLLTGASLGNYELFLKLTSHSDISALWSAVDNQTYCGRWLTQTSVDRERAVAIETAHAATYQETSYRCAGLHVRKRTFVPMRETLLRIVHVQLFFENATDAPIRATVTCDVHYPAFVWPGTYKIPDMAERNKRVAQSELDGLIVSTTTGRENETRVFGADAPIASTALSDRGFVRSYAVDVPARGTREVAFNLAVGSEGAERVLREYRDAPPAQDALVEADAYYERAFSRGYVRTPEAALNRAFDWAKINTIRVQHRFPSGFGFTNDPSQDVVVTRDAAWYVMGSDYFTPEFSRGMLGLIAQHGIEPGGKITEFINACADPPARSDYDLNINDDTPLVAAAVWHHFAMTRDRASLEQLWPMAQGAVEWILTQIVDGLVVSNSREANVWGISGWRNIIPQGQISGAVTEINAECVYALRVGAQLARLLGREADAVRYADASDALRAAVNANLVNERTGLYLLNIDPDGVRHADLTGDQIFPVLFGVADESRKRKVLDVLYSPEFWTPFGVRTIGKKQEEYDPDYGVQLMGGVWPNLTAWVGYSGKSRSPRRLVSAMRNIWRISEIDNPRAYYNVVPGQFPERLSGHSFKSRGMAMSPWMPPTYLWLVYEGLLGIEPSVEGLRINPHIPDEWSWVGARDVPVLGAKLSMFYHRRKLHTTMAVGSRSRCEVYDEDVTRFIECDAPFSLALRAGRRVVVFVATDDPGSFEVRLHPPLVANDQHHRVSLRAGGNRFFEVRLPARTSTGTHAAR